MIRLPRVTKMETVGSDGIRVGRTLIRWQSYLPPRITAIRTGPARYVLEHVYFATGVAKMADPFLKGFGSTFTSHLTDVSADTYNVKIVDEWEGMDRGQATWAAIQYMELQAATLAQAYISAVRHGSTVPPAPPWLLPFIEAGGGLPVPAPVVPPQGA